jgi:hypothetical protein
LVVRVVNDVENAVIVPDGSIEELINEKEINSKVSESRMDRPLMQYVTFYIRMLTGSVDWTFMLSLTHP